MQMLVQAACEYAQRGWHVLPLKPRDKIPATTHGVKDATTDVEQIKAWWEENPDYNIGIACGPSNLMVVDFDPRNEGTEYQSLLESVDALGTVKYLTGGGGYHFLFVKPEGKLRGGITSGVDVKSSGGYIVAPPSVHPNGNHYEWGTGNDPMPCPEWLTALVTKEDLERTLRVDDPNDTRPGTEFNRSQTFRSILEPHGWTFIEENGTEEYWRRPGKTTGISATANYENSGLFYVFTSSTEFESGRGYDKVGMHAVLNFNGDVSAALQDIKETYVGPAIEIPVFSMGKPAYEFSSDLPAPHFVRRYIDYATKQTDAPYEYHEAAALTLLAVVTTNLRANLAPYPGGLATNLYAILVGGTTRSRKSTSQNIAADIFKQVVPYSILPSRVTTEALVSILANHGGLSSLWMPDEFGMVISEIGRRDFLRGIEELLLSLYGGKEYVYTKVNETVTVRNPHLSVLGAATPESLALAGPTAMLGGLLPRFAVVFPEGLPEAKPAASIPDLTAERADLVRSLREVTMFSDEARVVTFSDAAVKILNVAENTLVDSGPHIARLPTMLYKVSMLHAAGRMAAEVSAEDAAAAVTTVYRWRDGANRLQPFMRRKREDIEFSREMFAALDILREIGGTAHRSQVARRVGVNRNKMNSIQSTLEDQGWIEVDRTTGAWKMR
jgi:hypothetical protein